MKKRRLAIVAFLLCACMVMGLGYAAMSNKLIANANAHSTQGELDVYFTAAAKGENCKEASLDTTAGKCLSATMTTDSLTTVGQNSIATFTITNNESATDNIVAKIEAATVSNNNDTYFDVSYTFTAGEGTTVAADGQSVTNLPAGKSVTLTVTVTLKKAVIDTNEVATISLTYAATAIGN